MHIYNEAVPLVSLSFCALQSLASHIKEMIELVDVIFKWSVLRFCESNTTCLLKVNIFAFSFVMIDKKYLLVGCKDHGVFI
jgi:hypothetical protein